MSALQPLRAQSATDPGDLFVSVYTTVKEAEKAEQSGNLRGALAKFRYASEVLDSIATKYPTWRPEIVTFRKQRTAEAITRVQAQVAKFGPGKGVSNDGGNALEGGLPTSDDPLNFAPPIEAGSDPAPSAPPRTGPRKNPKPREGDVDTTADLEGAIGRMKKMQSDLREASAAADRAEREKKELVRKFEDAIQAREASEKQQKVLQTRADGAEERLLKAQSEVKIDVEKIKALQTEATEAKRAVRTGRIDQDADAEIRKQLDDRMKAAQLKIATLTEQRNALDKASKDDGRPGGRDRSHEKDAVRFARGERRRRPGGAGKEGAGAQIRGRDPGAGGVREAAEDAPDAGRWRGGAAAESAVRGQD